jgi:hypothetical protein
VPIPVGTTGDHDGAAAIDGLGAGGEDPFGLAGGEVAQPAAISAITRTAPGRVRRTVRDGDGIMTMRSRQVPRRMRVGALTRGHDSGVAAATVAAARP